MTSQTSDQQSVQTMTPFQWIRMILVYFLIPFLLLAFGGELGWWQGWVYSFLLLVTGIGGRILTEQRHPGLLAERVNFEKLRNAKPWDKVLAPLMAVSFSFPLVIVAGLDHRYAWTPQFWTWLNIFGLVLIALGYAFATWAFIENRFFFTAVYIQTDGEHAVCDSGPYRFVRHPGYAGNLLALPGMVFAFSSVWILIPAMAALIITVIRTALEDRTLHEELPGYREYVQRVRYRLLPWVY
ncbi:isoprenylcysteine carboxylmethyltransferase family protein [Sulfurimonas sp. HSL-1716]|uniref:methyltransferase family protein n=1 Tax=Hydrocurvibacter sulfurireducens TaxID=3131937 RepID=UPI0031F95E87